MNQDPENFETLRKLLALKRHEQPPPGYFAHLPRRIATRLEYGEGDRTFWDRMSAILKTRPSLVYAFGLTACGAVSVSLLCTTRLDVVNAAEPSPELEATRVREPAGAFSSQMAVTSTRLHVPNWVGDTNLGVQAEPLPSLFATHPNGMTRQAAYHQ